MFYIWVILALYILGNDECVNHITRASTDCVKLSLFVHGTAQKPPFSLHCVAGVICNRMNNYRVGKISWYLLCWSITYLCAIQLVKVFSIFYPPYVLAKISSMDDSISFQDYGNNLSLYLIQAAKELEMSSELLLFHWVYAIIFSFLLLVVSIYVLKLKHWARYSMGCLLFLNLLQYQYFAGARLDWLINDKVITNIIILLVMTIMWRKLAAYNKVQQDDLR